MNRNLTGLGSENITRKTDDIADIYHLFEILILVNTKGITGNIYLDVTGFIGNIDKGSLTHYTLAHHTACKGNIDRYSIHNSPALVIVCLYYFFCFFFREA